ncbi:MAG: FAD-dependent oxidoreductase, partial [Candidatus Rokuibacteriota bacterium]
MSAKTAEVVICGAGIAGIAAAYHLAVRRGVTDVVLVDERPPLSLTSDKSTECYRNWWPGPGDDMVALMNRSIDVLEELARESGNAFLLNRRGYLFATADEARVGQFIGAAQEAAALGAGPVRLHASAASGYEPPRAEGFDSPLTGSDVITEPALIRRHFGYLAPDTVAVLHARRCGWFSGQQLGMYLLERARERGVRLMSGRVESVDAGGGRVR